MEVRDEIEILRRELEKANKSYYQDNISEMSDYDFDRKMRRLAELEAAYPQFDSSSSPTKHVGGTASDRFGKVRHSVPLPSLQDVFSESELEEFIGSVRADYPDADFDVEPKIDGLSVALEYENGHFIRGATRGDGRVGEDVTENIKTIASVPLCLPESLPHLVVRGEVYIPRSVFRELNEAREKEGLTPFANPRNTASGSLRQLNPALAAERKMDILIFNVQLSDGIPFETHTDGLSYLKSQGFHVIDFFSVRNAEEAVRRVRAIGDERERYDYDIDGAVCKVNSIRLRSALGFTAKFPRWAVAFKYPPEEKETKITDILLQVGRTGVVTPKAVLESVHLAGTCVTAATLHNADFIRERDIRIGDTVVVRKAGEIIPEVLSVVKDKRPADSRPFVFPPFCPVCSAPLRRDPDGAAIRCIGAECPAQLLRNLTHFASRDAMNIDGLGPALLQALIDAKLLRTPADIYQLTYEDLVTIDRMGTRSANNLMRAVEKSKQNDLSKLIYAFGIRQVGTAAAEDLARHFHTLDALCAASEEEISSVRDIGPVTAGCIKDWVSLPQSRHLMSSLADRGVNMRCNLPEYSGNLAGSTFVLTGELSSLTRSEAEKKIKSRGGRVTSSVSKKTSYAVLGDNPGNKYQKALSLGVPILTESEFMNLLGEEMTAQETFL